VILLIRFAEGAMEAVAGSAAYGEAIVFLGLGIKHQVQRLKKSVDAPCFSSAF
jgi:hypothetical protein